MFCWRSDGTLTPPLDPWDIESSKPTTSLCDRVSGGTRQKMCQNICRQPDTVDTRTNQPTLGGSLLPRCRFGGQGRGALGGRAYIGKDSQNCSRNPWSTVQCCREGIPL